MAHPENGPSAQTHLIKQNLIEVLGGRFTYELGYSLVFVLKFKFIH